MSNDATAEHAARIQEQFSRQALSFAALPAHSNAEGFELFARAAELGPEDDVLDVACGPGLVACKFALRVKTMRGLDVVPKMLEQARARAREQGLTNVRFDLGDTARLQYANGSFSRVITRYSFHHLIDPETTLREMVRVCRPGGTVAVCDVAPAQHALDAYNRMEKIRDPSHAAAMAPAQLQELFERVELRVQARAQYRLENFLEEVLGSSFPDPGGREKVREMFSEDVGVNALGVGVERRKGELWFWFPISILSARTTA